MAALVGAWGLLVVAAGGLTLGGLGLGGLGLVASAPVGADTVPGAPG